MFFNWKKKKQRSRFYRMTRAVLDTPPMPVQEAPLAIVSMIENADVQMYLIAMKSFYSRIKRGKLIAIIDRDMPADSRATLERHFPGIRFEILEDIDTGACQRGGTWERLVYMIERSQNEYAIQIDADTLTFGTNIDEVIDCVKSNRAFTLSGAPRSIKGMYEVAVDARASDSNYIGIVTERNFDRYPGADRLSYVRGSSGFAGFSKGGMDRSKIESFHRHFAQLLGKRWTEWGTEQNGSNFAIANSPGALVLPHPKYAVFTPQVERDRSAFLHFIGTYRYLEDYFAHKSQAEIAGFGGQPTNLED
jgi:hypothetical protein